MEFRQYFSVLWRWLWLIVLATLVTAFVSFLVTSRQPKVYEATTRLLVGRSIQIANPNSGDIQTSQQLALTYTEIARTTAVIQGAINALHASLTVDEVNRSMSATVVPDTELIEIRVDDTDPVRAQNMANELAHQLMLQAPSATQPGQSPQRDFTAQQVTDLQQKIDQANKTVTELQSSIQAGTTATVAQEKQAQISALQSQITIWQQAYASLLPFLGNGSPNYLSIIEPAQLPSTPVSPNVPLTTMLAAVTGLALGIVAALLLEYLNDSVRTTDDVKQGLQLPGLGVISRINGGKHGKLLDGLSPLSGTVEAYRAIRYNLQFNGGENLKSLLVTSPSLNDGKSLTAANLAIMMAQSGLRTILVDADLRKPTQHILFGLNNDVGLTNGFMATPPPIDIVRATRLENLCVVTSGAKPLNPAELLASERMRKLIHRFQSEADIIIFDSPPCLPVVDSTILARQVDGVVLVVDGKRTPRRTAQKAKELLSTAGGRVVGVILNRADGRGKMTAYA